MAIAAIRIRGHVRIPESQHPPSQRFQKSGSYGVIDGIDMLASVELDRKLGFAAGDIADVAADAQLAREARAIARYPIPDQALCIG